MTRRFTILTTVVVLLAPEAQGQLVRGTAREAESGRAIESGVITLVDTSGAVIRAVLTDSLGEFGVRAPSPGAYRLRFERLGFRPITTDRFILDEGETETKAIRAAAVSISLDRIVVTDRPRCRVLPEADTLTARVWSAVRGVLASAAAGESGWYPYVTIERYERDYDYRRKLVTKERKWTQTGASTAPFVAIAASVLEKKGFVVSDGDTVTFYAPEARTLIAEEFLRTHCFRVRDERTERGRVGLDIEPVPRRFVPDIKGTLWLDAATGELRRLDFIYVNLPPMCPLIARRVGWSFAAFRAGRGSWTAGCCVCRSSDNLPRRRCMALGCPSRVSCHPSGLPSSLARTRKVGASSASTRNGLADRRPRPSRTRCRGSCAPPRARPFRAPVRFSRAPVTRPSPIATGCSRCST